MDDQLANAIKARLDKELAGADLNVGGIRFELDLFRAFKDRDGLRSRVLGRSSNRLGPPSCQHMVRTSPLRHGTFPRTVTSYA